MNWFTDAIGLTTAEENTPTPTATAQEQESSRIQKRTTLLAKIKGTNKDNSITAEEIQDFKNTGGKLDEIINTKTQETLLDRAIKLNNTQAAEALKKEGAVPGEATNKARMNKDIQPIPNEERRTKAEKQPDPIINIPNEETEQQAKKEQVSSDNSRDSSRASSPTTITHDHNPQIDIPPKTWNKANPDAAIDADKERADKVAKIEAGKNQAIVKPQKTGAEIAAKMEEQLKARKEASQGAATGKIDFSTMKKVGKGSGVGGR